MSRVFSPTRYVILIKCKAKHEFACSIGRVAFVVAGGFALIGLRLSQR
jgi:hypothetical protein